MQTANTSKYFLGAVPTPEEAEQASVVRRCIMAALDHSKAPRIVVLDESGQPEHDVPAIAVPPGILRLLADVLGRLSQRQPIALVPFKYEVSTQEAAEFMNVSRPFIVKELEARRLPFRKVGTHRRILFEDLIEYQENSRKASEEALAELAEQAQDLRLGY